MQAKLQTSFCHLWVHLDPKVNLDNHNDRHLGQLQSPSQRYGLLKSALLWIFGVVDCDSHLLL